ncbi:uncharacterized protein LOC103996897 isoform X3 [Musa acuminata AAA Group]|uniref:uncharacterized protein LOC103996897 isoform X3 n=1 Tax=Musa acuminata AAA Group TaxID=214697 RepID=UPI0031D03B5A
MEYEDRCRQSQRGKYDCLLFDLDDTLYPLSSGIAIQCRNNIGDYLVEKLGIEENKVSALCNLLYKNYGTTMAGLKAIGYDFDYDDYHSFVHGRLPHENLKPDPVLRQLLLSLPIRKVVFTNADEVHAAKVLKKLRLEDCFEGIICFETLNPPSSSSVTETSSQIFDIVEHFARPDTGGIELPKTPILCKPSLEAMEYALRIANIDPQRTVRRIYVRSRRSLNSVADTIHLFTMRCRFSLMTACGTFNQGNALGCTLCWWALRTKSKAPTTLWKASITSGKHCPGCGRRPRNPTALGTPARSQWKHRSLLSSSPSSSSIHHHGDEGERINLHKLFP